MFQLPNFLLYLPEASAWFPWPLHAFSSVLMTQLAQFVIF